MSRQSLGARPTGSNKLIADLCVVRRYRQQSTKSRCICEYFTFFVRMSSITHKR